ncbi:MAG: hypothetical protein NT067_04280 [Candidatus Diapherotrites archaeon]|nr:hypothetical protein [Candidatus Diapherotrites archaeon]
MKVDRLWVAWIVLLVFVFAVMLVSGVTGNYYLYNLPFLAWFFPIAFALLSLLSVLHVKKTWAAWLFSVIFFLFVFSAFNSYDFSSFVRDLDFSLGYYYHPAFGQTIGIFSALFSAVQVIFFPLLFFIARKRSWPAGLQTLLMINAFLFALSAYWGFLGGFGVIESNYYSLESELIPPSPYYLFLGEAASFSILCFLLNAVILLFIALAAVFLEKMALLKEKNLVYCLAISIAVLYFAGCMLMASFVLEGNRSMLTYNFSEKCSAEVYQRWTPEYAEQMKALNSESVNQELDSYVSGEYRYLDEFGHESAILDKEYVRAGLMKSQLESQRRREFYDCFYELKAKTDFGPADLVFPLMFLPTGLACLVFSRKVFTKKKYANEALEKGFMFAGITLLYYGILLIAAGSYYSGLALLSAIPLALLAAHWLGWRPSFLKKKQPKAKS